MLGIGAEELLLVLIVALLVLGPERLPRVARDVGRVVGDLRRTSDEFREEFLQADKFLAAEKVIDKVSPPVVAEPVSPQAAATTPSDPNETAFDREMREAREKLAATREKPLN